MRPSDNNARAVASAWHVYIVRCKDNTLYTGIARDVARRVDQHNGVGRTGARYTRARRPVRLVYQEPAADRSSAATREYAIKRLSRGAKLTLVAGAIKGRAKRRRTVAQPVN